MTRATEVVFNEVLMVSDDKEVKIGKPFVDGAKVVGEIIAQKKGPKLIVYQMNDAKVFIRKPDIVKI